MLYAIFSDLHDNRDAFHQVLDDAAAHHAEQFVYLGDVGRDLRLFEALRQRDIPCLFGNWEAGAVLRMSKPWSEWVGAWPATLRLGDAIFCHATPDMPRDVLTASDAAQAMRTGSSMSWLFPRLNIEDDARWKAFAKLEEVNALVAFHGHTHVQKVWVWEVHEGSVQRRMRGFVDVSEFQLQPGPTTAPNRYLVGVGSAGQPLDGRSGRYALYDDATQTVVLRRLNE